MERASGPDTKENHMNEKRNDRQSDKTGREGGVQRDQQQGNQPRRPEEEDRSRTGQVGGGGAREDTARQGQPGRDQQQKKGDIGQPHKPGRDMDEDVE
jgi:hypothetical protein